MTDRISAGWAAISIDWDDGSGICSPPDTAGPWPLSGSVFDRERYTRAPEVTDVDAFGPADAATAYQRVEHVAKEHQPGLGVPDRVQHRLAPPLEPASPHVVEQLGQCRWDVAAQHVDVPDRRNLGGIVLVADLV